MNIQELAEQIRETYQAAPLLKEASIERLLRKNIENLSRDEKLRCMEELIKYFSSPVSDMAVNDLLELFSILLDRPITAAELSSEELLERLSGSLQMIFRELNEILQGMQKSDLGSATEDKTIRIMIEDILQDQNYSNKLEDHLKQIKGALGNSHKAYKKAACALVDKITGNLDPATIKSSMGKFGSFQKMYERQFHNCQNWINSEQFMAEFIQQFETSYQQLLKEEGK